MPDKPTMAARLMEIYDRFYAAYGPQPWWPGDGPCEVIAGAILTHSAAWTNVEMALANMKAAGCWSLEAVHQTPQEELAVLVRSSGYFNAKARKLIGWQPQHNDLGEIVRSAWEWFEAHPEGYGAKTT